MFSFLKGMVDGMDDDGAIAFDVCGVGYKVAVSDRDRAIIKGRTDLVRLFVQPIIREDSFTLYGFLDADDRNVFGRIIKVQGCGPSVAIKLLSVMDAKRIRAAVAINNPDAFKGVHGVGKVLALKLMKVKL